VFGSSGLVGQQQCVVSKKRTIQQKSLRNTGLQYICKVQIIACLYVTELLSP